MRRLRNGAGNLRTMPLHGSHVVARRLRACDDSSWYSFEARLSSNQRPSESTKRTRGRCATAAAWQVFCGLSNIICPRRPLGRRQKRRRRAGGCRNVMPARHSPIGSRQRQGSRERRLRASTRCARCSRHVRRRPIIQPLEMSRLPRVLGAKRSCLASPSAPARLRADSAAEPP